MQNTVRHRPTVLGEALIERDKNVAPVKAWIIYKWEKHLKELSGHQLNTNEYSHRRSNL